MPWLWISLGVFALVCVALLVAFYCYRRVFYSPPRKQTDEIDFVMPDGDDYDAYRDAMIEWVKWARSLPHEDCSVLSYDGLTLRAKYYECEKGAPIELLFHGYRGDGERDLSAGIERCFALKRNVLIVDQRASGRSDGNTITFGVKEKFDCLTWVNFVNEHFGTDTQLLISGVSMGAATVVMAAAEELPDNVLCVLADCGYTSAEEMIKKVIAGMKLPVKLTYPFVWLGARIFGNFNLSKARPLDAVDKCRIPILFIHGGADKYVPAEMSQRMYERYQGKKGLKFIDGAGHGLAYPVNKQAYLKTVAEFEKEWKK